MNKESFILFAEQREIFENLTDKQAGQLIKAIFEYESTRIIPELDKTVKVAFIPIKQTLDKNYEKYIEKCEQNKLNGKKGGRPKKPKETEQNPNKPNGFFENPKNLDNEYDNDILDDYKDIFNYLCMVAEKFPNSKEQVNFYQQCMKKIIAMGKGEIIANLDISKLSKCWEKMNQQRGVENKESYFISCLINEVEQ